MIFEVHNNKTKIIIQTSEDQDAYEALRDEFKYRDKGYQYAQAYIDNVWDGYTNVIKYKKFGTGLLPYILSSMRDNGFSYTIDDRRQNEFKAPELPSENLILGPDTLRPEQEDVVRKMFPIFPTQDISMTWYRGMIWAATNSGKTHIIGWLFDNLPKDTTILFLVHRKLIFNQIIEFLNELGIDYGIYGQYKNQKPKKELKRITLAMNKTMSVAASKGDSDLHDWLSEVNTVIVDESHATTSNEYKTLLAVTNAYAVYFFSGTALGKDKGKNYAMLGMSGPVMGRITNKQLIDLGRSQKPTVHIHYCDQDILFFEDNDHGLRTATYSKDRIRVIREEILSNPKGSVLIYVEKTQQGDWIYDQIIDLPVVVEFTHGSDKNINQKKQDFTDGKINVLIATGVFSTGINVKIITTCIFCPIVSSNNIVLQVFGRLLRHDGVNDECKFIDFMDKADGPRKHSKARISMYKKEKFDIIHHETK